MVLIPVFVAPVLALLLPLAPLPLAPVALNHTANLSDAFISATRSTMVMGAVEPA